MKTGEKRTKTGRHTRRGLQNKTGNKCKPMKTDLPQADTGDLYLEDPSENQCKIKCLVLHLNKLSHDDVIMLRVKTSTKTTKTPGLIVKPISASVCVYECFVHVSAFRSIDFTV